MGWALLKLAAWNARLADNRTDGARRHGLIAFVRNHDHPAVTEPLHDDVVASVVIVFKPVPFHESFQFECTQSACSSQWSPLAACWNEKRSKTAWPLKGP